MDRKIYNKLVRDNIVDMIKADGKKAYFTILHNDSDMLNALIWKIQEEASELMEALFKNTDKNNVLEELADLETIFECIKEIILKRSDSNQYIEIKETKNLKNGKFNKRMCLLCVESDDSNTNK